jgi:hypothetical protein
VTTPQRLVALQEERADASMAAMGGKTRNRLWGDRVRAGKVHVEAARRRAIEALREADVAACRLWSDTMEGFGGPAQPSPTIDQCMNAGYGFLEVQCKHCRNRVSIPLEYVRRPRDTPIWKLESAFRCRSCSTKRYSPPVQLVKLTTKREVALAPWYGPDEDERR